MDRPIEEVGMIWSFHFQSWFNPTGEKGTCNSATLDPVVLAAATVQECPVNAVNDFNQQRCSKQLSLYQDHYNDLYSIPV